MDFLSQTLVVYALLFFSLKSPLLSDMIMPSQDEITYEFLADSPWTDHVYSFKKLFELEPVDSFLEFGLGLGTKYYLENCKHVTSIELVVDKRSQYIETWYYQTVDLLKHNQNWSPQLHLFSNIVNEANLLALQGLNPKQARTDYLIEINELLDAVFKDTHFDVAFVDPGIHIRGHIVNALFDRCDIIVLHDTNFNKQVYGTDRVLPPNNYETIRSIYGSGITFWIVKEKGDLIRKLKGQLNSSEI